MIIFKIFTYDDLYYTLIQINQVGIGFITIYIKCIGFYIKLSMYNIYKEVYSILVISTYTFFLGGWGPIPWRSYPAHAPTVSPLKVISKSTREVALPY